MAGTGGAIRRGQHGSATHAHALALPALPHPLLAQAGITSVNGVSQSSTALAWLCVWLTFFLYIFSLGVSVGEKSEAAVV